MAKTSSAVAELMREDAAKPPPKDRLDQLRAKVAELRTLERDRADLTERLKENGTKIYEMKTKTLVDLFDLAKIDNVGIPEEGNLPAYNMEIDWIIKANIGTPDEPKVDDFEKSIAYIRKLEPDLIKTTFKVEFGLRENDKRQKFEALLKKNKISYSSSFGVPWNSLTAWVKGQFEAKKPLNLKLLGATIERAAQLIKPKATRAKKAAADQRATPKRGK
jgi:hypothetical protein